MSQIAFNLLEKTISGTEALIRRGEVNWALARRGVLHVVRDLCRRHPEIENEIKKKFDPFIIRNDKNNASVSSSEAVIVEQIQGDASTLLIRARRDERFSSFARAGVVNLDGREYPARILNLSRTGVGLEAGFKPPIGTPFVIGDAAARVVRHFEKGFAGEFLQPVELEAFASSL
jgi:hypothetical protein